MTASIVPEETHDIFCWNAIQMAQLPRHFNAIQRGTVFCGDCLILYCLLGRCICWHLVLFITTAAACTGTVIYRMSGASNAHAELASQATAAYDSNVVCCSGVTGLGNACSGTFATALKLSGVTNAHSEQNSQANYANNACIQAPSGGTVSIGYQATNCTGFDTTLGSMTGTTNAHTGDGTAYTTKICGTAAVGSQSLTFSISDNTIGFGTLVSGGRGMLLETRSARHRTLLMPTPFRGDKCGKWIHDDTQWRDTYLRRKYGYRNRRNGRGVKCWGGTIRSAAYRKLRHRLGYFALC